MLFCGDPRGKQIKDHMFKMGYEAAVDDVQENLIRNSRTEIIDGKVMLIVTEKTIKTICNELKRM